MADLIRIALKELLHYQNQNETNNKYIQIFSLLS